MQKCGSKTYTILKMSLPSFSSTLVIFGIAGD